MEGERVSVPVALLAVDDPTYKSCSVPLNAVSPERSAMDLELPEAARPTLKVAKALFIASNLPDPGKDRTYQLWTLKDGAPTPADLVRTGGNVRVWIHGGPIRSSTVRRRINVQRKAPSGEAGTRVQGNNRVVR